MSTEITTSKTFQERMFERVREHMGDLLTEEDLKKIVDTALQKAFFEERKIRLGVGYRDEIRPAIFVEMIQTELQEQVKKALVQWLQDNNEVVQQTIEKVIQEGITKVVMQTLEARMTAPLYSFADQLRSQGVFK